MATTTLTTASSTSTPTTTTTTTTPHVGADNDIEQGRISHRNSTDSSDEDEGSSSSGESCTVDKGGPNRVVVNDKKTTRPSSASTSSSSCLSECSVEDELVDLESGVVESKMSRVHSAKVERDCRICHLSLDGSNPDSGFPIELGCSCKEDLAAAHKHCAEAWFKIRGNKTCEICGSTARNVVGVNEVELMEQWNEANDAAAAAAVPPHPADQTRHFWQGHRFLNFLLACMVFAFVISWLFHFNVPS